MTGSLDEVAILAIRDTDNPIA
nr:hypothetical protein [Candidatus Kuenenia stuttgartiensis]